jgi:hypothetical protein
VSAMRRELYANIFARTYTGPRTKAILAHDTPEEGSGDEYPDLNPIPGV